MLYSWYTFVGSHVKLLSPTIDDAPTSLLAIMALSALQSFPWLLIHNAILFINISTVHGTREAIG